MARSVICAVEPDARLRGALEEHLTAGGYRVRVYGKLGDDVFSDSDAEIDLLVLCPDSVAPSPEQKIPNLERVALIVILDPRIQGDVVAATVEWMRRGAADVLIKPVNGVTLLGSLHRALKVQRLQHKLNHLESEVADLSGRGVMIGSSEAIHSIYRIMERIAPSLAPVLILGETGVGKELVAREIHRLSKRRGDFVAVNAAILSEQLFESEMFGYEPGAFTGAKGRKIGLAELADDGTLFLDEIGELPPFIQSRLLRFLDESRFRRLGGLREITVDVRIIAATNRDLEQNINEKDAGFRSDLFYRLAGCVIRVAPLRERTADLPDLARHFLAQHARTYRRVSPRLDDDALGALARYPWPGNARELRNFIDRVALSFEDGQLISAAELEPLLPIARNQPTGTAATNDYRALRSRHMADFDQAFLLKVLQQHQNNISSAAKEVGLDRKTFSAKLKGSGGAASG